MGPGSLRCGGDAKDHPHPHGCCSVLGFPHPWRWIQPQDLFLSLHPASRQECAGSSSLLCWPRLASLTPRACWRCHWRGHCPQHPPWVWGPALGVCVSLPALGARPAPPPSAASPSSPSPQPDSQHLPVPGAGSGPLGGPLPTLPSPPAPGVQECLPGKPCRARVAWELGNLIPGNGGRAEGRGHSQAAAGPWPPLSLCSDGAPRNGDLGRGGSRPRAGPSLGTL